MGPATVIVTIGYDDLAERLGYGTTSDPAVLSHTGAVLELGRTRRIATHTQTLALIVRDRGCSFPVCGRAPEWCERHHITEWVDGGLTDLDNLTLLCRYHHHNFASRGWTCRINDDRLPEWRPPRWVDQDQKPLLNSRITAQLTAPRRRQRRDRRAGRAGPDGAPRPPKPSAADPGTW
jgi:hypothetical protein